MRLQIELAKVIPWTERVDFSSDKRQTLYALRRFQVAQRNVRITGIDHLENLLWEAFPEKGKHWERSRVRRAVLRYALKDPPKPKYKKE